MTIAKVSVHLTDLNRNSGSTTANDSNPNPSTVVLTTNNSSDQTIDFGYIFCDLDQIGGINLGKASTGAVIGLVNTKIVNSNVTIVGDEYVSQGGSISNMAPSTITGNVFEFAAGQYSGPGKLLGMLIVDPALLTQVDSDALSASAAACALAPTQTFGSINSATTIVGNGGQNVIKINGDIKKNLTLSGTSHDIFIVNVTGTLTLGGSDAIALAGGVTANNVLSAATGVTFGDGVPISYPAGYGTLGPLGGDGKILVGSSANVLTASTSLSDSINSPAFTSGFAVNSPPETFPLSGISIPPGWDYFDSYHVLVSHLAFGANGFGAVTVPLVYNSPSKNGINQSTPTLICNLCHQCGRCYGNSRNKHCFSDAFETVCPHRPMKVKFDGDMT